MFFRLIPPGDNALERRLLHRGGVAPHDRWNHCLRHLLLATNENCLERGRVNTSVFP